MFEVVQKKPCHVYECLFYASARRLCLNNGQQRIACTPQPRHQAHDRARLPALPSIHKTLPSYARTGRIPPTLRIIPATPHRSSGKHMLHASRRSHIATYPMEHGGCSRCSLCTLPLARWRVCAGGRWMQHVRRLASCRLACSKLVAGTQSGRADHYSSATCAAVRYFQPGDGAGRLLSSCPSADEPAWHLASCWSLWGVTLRLEGYQPAGDVVPSACCQRLWAAAGLPQKLIGQQDSARCHLSPPLG